MAARTLEEEKDYVPALFWGLGALFCLAGVFLGILSPVSIVLYSLSIFFFAYGHFGFNHTLQTGLLAIGWIFSFLSLIGIGGLLNAGSEPLWLLAFPAAIVLAYVVEKGSKLPDWTESVTAAFDTLLAYSTFLVVIAGVYDVSHFAPAVGTFGLLPGLWRNLFAYGVIIMVYIGIRRVSIEYITDRPEARMIYFTLIGSGLFLILQAFFFIFLQEISVLRLVLETLCGALILYADQYLLKIVRYAESHIS